MDSYDDYIWQRRIHHGVRHQKSAVPFPESVAIGLEFNAALEKKEKLDPSLLTNSVMLEVCDFAKTVTKSETYFLFEMLEFNFHIGIDADNDLQCYEYSRRVHSKIKLLKEQIKMKPRRWKETFPLPDPNTIMGFTGPEHSGRYYPKRNRTVDSSVLTDGSKNSHSSENGETNVGASSPLLLKKAGRARVKLTSDVYPFCKELGVSLAVRPDDTSKRKLEPNLVTNGVMMELLDFSRVLCGTHTGIVYDLIKQNFGLELDKMQFRVQMSKLMERKCACLTAEDRDAFRKETLKVQTKKQEQVRKKRRNSDADYQELEKLTVASKRRGTLRHKDNDAREIWQDSDLSYMCPVDFEMEMQPGSEAGPDQMMFESLSGTPAETKVAVSLDVQREEELFVSPVQPQTNGYKYSLFNHCPKTTALRAVSDLFSVDKNGDTCVKTLKQRLWARRATRSKQILKCSRVKDMFPSCRDIGLDFNVGSGNKQNLDLQQLTNCVLQEVSKFAAAMTKSLCSFLFDILNNNFSLVLQDEMHQRNFIFYMITKEKILRKHPARQEMEFLNSPVQFPEVYNTVNVTSDCKSGQNSEREQQKNCDPPALANSQKADLEHHPFCNKLGLNLWSTENCAVGQKLDLTVLTTGAVLEILSFVRELCGDVREMVNDILEHNFDLELQSGETEAAQAIQRWYATQKSLMKRQKTSSKKNRWLNRVILLNSQPPTSNHLEDYTDDLKAGKEMVAIKGNVTQMKRVNSYHICKEIGLDLDIGSKSETKRKLDLRVLTRGVLFEMHHYVRQNSQRYVPTLYKILEYNFDLSSQNHRKVEFAWSIASQVIAMTGKNSRKGDYLNTVFELPFEMSQSSETACKEEPEDGFGELDLNDNSDIMFVRELKPVDIEVEIE